MALVAGFEEEKIAEILSLGNSDSPVYSHIISIDGSSMIRSGEAVRDNYFQRLYDEITGEEEKYVEELRTAMGKTDTIQRCLWWTGSAVICIVPGLNIQNGF